MTAEIGTDDKGIPLKGMYPEGVAVTVFVSVFQGILGLVGYGIARYFVYGGEESKAKADAKIAILAEYELGWMYLGIIAITFLQIPLFVALGEARKNSKTRTPDQHVYEVKGAEGSKLGYVLMVTDGIQGGFNRAQRAWSNYHEHMTTIGDDVFGVQLGVPLLRVFRVRCCLGSCPSYLRFWLWEVG